MGTYKLDVYNWRLQTNNRTERNGSMTYSEIQVPRKKINKELQHNLGLRPLYGYMDTKVEIRKRLIKRSVRDRFLTFQFLMYANREV